VLYGHLDVTSEDDWNAAVADALDSGTELVIDGGFIAQ
jgi:hypothetical protein